MNKKTPRTEADTIAELSQLARAHGAESRAADIVAENALRGRYRYSPAIGWLEWDGRRWDAADTAEPRVIESVRQFIDTTERHYRHLANGTDDEAIDATRQADMWHNFMSAGKIRAITSLCRGMKGILTSVTEFDAHPDVLNCHNGVVDLRTGKLYPSNPDLLLTHLAGGDYIPDARSATWDKALEAVHADIKEWFQTRIGQAATGHTPDDDCLIVSAGGGENGKSATMLGIMRALGTYARLISHRILIAQPGQHPTELMDLRGLRLALLEETPEEGRLDTHRVKNTVGTPQITARRMRENDVTFDASHTLFVNTNFLPQVDSTDHATWRRLRAMPWPYRFLKPGQPVIFDTDRPGDRTLKARLQAGKDVPAAALAYIVEGAMRWYAANRVSPEDPPAVRDATDTWRATSDVGLQFAMDRLVASANHYITAETMRKEFSTFLTDQGKREWSAQTLNTRLPESLAAAGIYVSAVPTAKAKVRQADEESRPVAAWPSDDTAPGATLRMWRGVRFKTPAERSGHLKAV